MTWRRSVVLLALLSACSQTIVVDPSDGASSTSDGGPSVTPDGSTEVDQGLADSGANSADAAPRLDGGFAVNEPCEQVLLPCIDSNQPNVYPVTDGPSLVAALGAAGFGDTIQIRAARISNTVRIPTGVTLRGCEGSQIGPALFEGGSGVLEGFVGEGPIVAEESGSYIIRNNVFTGRSGQPPVQVSALIETQGATIEALISNNRFEDGDHGIDIGTRYDTFERDLDVRIVNNVFVRTLRPIYISEVGNGGRIRAQVEHNTMFDFTVGVHLLELDEPVTLKANLLDRGDLGVFNTTPFNVEYTMLTRVMRDSETPPASGTFVGGIARFNDELAGDLRLRPTSSAIDQVPTSSGAPARDHAGCPRPRQYRDRLLADIGAYEAQPVLP